MINIDDDIIIGTCDLHPEELKKFICMEELGELVQAISKRMRDKIDAKHGIDTTTEVIVKHENNEAEEIADVLLCIKMLQYYDIIDDSEIQYWIDYKQNRQVTRDYETFCKKAGGRARLINLGKYAQKCKEVFDENELHEEQTEGNVSDE